MYFLKSSIIISIFTLISRFFGFIRDIFFAKYLGTGYYSDIFLTAFKLPNFFRNIFAEGAFNSSFVPIFASKISENEKDRNKIIDFSRNIFSIVLYFLLLFTLVIEILMPFVIKIIAPGFINYNDKYLLAISLSRITFPYLIFISLVSLMSGILNSLNKFVATSVVPIVLNISFILFSILSSFININIAYILSIAILIGGLFQFIFIFYFTYKNKIILYPKKIIFDDLTKKFFKIFSNGFLSSGVIQINSMIDGIFSTKFVGAISYIYYTDRIVQLPLALIGTAISLSILSILSKKVNENNGEQFLIQEQAILISLFLGIPCSILLFNLADLVIPFVFERGKFTVGDSLNVIKCLKIYSLAIPSFILTKIFQTIYFSNQDTKLPLYASITSLISNIILNIILTKFIGYKGIILSTVISSFLNISVLLFFLYKKKYIKLSLGFIINLLKLIYPIMFMILTLKICDKYILVSITSKLLQFIKLCIASGLSGIIYLFVSFILKIINFDFIFNKNVRKNRTIN